MVNYNAPVKRDSLEVGPFFNNSRNEALNRSVNKTTIKVAKKNKKMARRLFVAMLLGVVATPVVVETVEIVQEANTLKDIKDMVSDARKASVVDNFIRQDDGTLTHQSYYNNDLLASRLLLPAPYFDLCIDAKLYELYCSSTTWEQNNWVYKVYNAMREQSKENPTLIFYDSFDEYLEANGFKKDGKIDFNAWGEYACNQVENAKGGFKK